MTLNELKEIDILNFDTNQISEHITDIEKLSSDDIYEYLCWVLESYDVQNHINIVELFKYAEFESQVNKILDIGEDVK